MNDQFNKLISEYAKELRVDIEEALNIGSKILIDELKLNSPANTGDFKNSWRVKTQYSGVRYIGNTKTVSGKKSNSIPLSNIIEYSETSKNKGFIQKTFNQSENKIYQEMVNHLKNRRK